MRRLTAIAPRCAGRDPRRPAEPGVSGRDADHDQHHVGLGSGRAVGSAPCTAAGLPRRVDRGDGGAGQHLERRCAASSSCDQRTELRGRRSAAPSGSCSTTVTARPRDRQRLGHFEADVPGADDDRALRAAAPARRVRTQAVAHRVQQVHPVVVDRREPAGRIGSAPVRRSACRSAALSPPSTEVTTVRASASIAAAVVLEQQLDPGQLQLVARAVGERAPVGDVAGEEVRAGRRWRSSGRRRPPAR